MLEQQLVAITPGGRADLPLRRFRVALLTPRPVSDSGWNAAADDGWNLSTGNLELRQHSFRPRRRGISDVVLASAVRSIPQVFLKIASQVKSGDFHPRMLEFGIADGMVCVVVNQHLESRIPASVMRQVKYTELGIISGRIVVPSEVWFGSTGKQQRLSGNENITASCLQVAFLFKAYNSALPLL